MTGRRAEKFVVLNLRLLAASFAVVGLLFIVSPDGVLDVISDLGDEIGGFTARAGDRRAVLARARLRLHGRDHRHLPGRAGRRVRYRPLLLVLAAGKAASSLAALGFYLFDDDVFIYLLNFLVDGFLALVGALPVVARRAGSARPAAPA